MEKKKAKKRKPWRRFRHKIMRDILYILLYPYAFFRYGLRPVMFKEQKGRQFLILYNHQTPFDQFFIGMTVRGAVYYLATEDIFSNGFVSSLIRFLVAPIPIKKQATDVSAVMNCIRVAREGGTIAIAPEGNRTYSGKTEYINPSIAPLAKKLALPIAFLRIEGGFGVQPRFSDVIRRGRMRSYVSRVMEPQEYAALSNEELCDVIRRELYVNEAKDTALFRHNRRAEYIERAAYVCPDCGLSVFESHGNTVMCQRCSLHIRYNEDTTIEGVEKPIPFRFFNDWYEYQNTFVSSLDLSRYTDTPMYTDTASMSEVIVHKKKQHMKDAAALSLYGDRLIIDEGQSTALVMPYSNISAMAICGKNKLNVYFDGRLYQFKGNKCFNALKYVNIYYHSKHMKRTDGHGEFLGL